MNVLNAFHGHAFDPRLVPTENPSSSNLIVKLSLKVAALLYTIAGMTNQKLIIKKNHMNDPNTSANGVILLK